MSKMTLVAPLAGWSASLDEAPDAVFAGRMLGDGLGIDPTETTLYAPCDGELIAVAATKHAITLRTPLGAEILLHVGIDTVGLGGAGFELHVRQGQQVRAGDRLLSFDLDLLARRARSLLTPVIVLDGGGFAVARRRQGCEVRVGDFLMELAPQAAGVNTASAGTPANAVGAAPVVSHSVRRRVFITLEHGIHARPAAMLAVALKPYTADVSIVVRGREASARSTVALMTLGVRKNDEIEVRAVGPDAVAAVAALEVALLSSAEGRTRASTAERGHPLRRNTVAQLPEHPSKDSNTLRGVIASGGLAVGQVLQYSRSELKVAEIGAGVEHENSELDRARSVVKTRLEQVAGSGPAVARDIVSAHLQLLDDPDLVGKARLAIATGKSAGYAWRQVMRVSVDALLALDDVRMAERVDDLLDLESQVLCVLDGDGSASTPRELPEKTVLIAQDLLPSQLVALDAALLAGICLAAGGPTSHVAILAAAMGLPMLVALGPAVLALPDGTPVVLDAENGTLRIAPDRGQTALAESELGRRLARRNAEQRAAQRACRTVDGTRIEVFANLGSPHEAVVAVGNGAEGCGLLRTEFLFLERHSPPDEVEQTTQYQSIAAALGGRPLTIRTLDIGGDKPIPYLPLPHEDNPALGLRGVRTSLWSPELLRVQLRAILGVRPETQPRILLPMITDPAELHTVRGILHEVCREVGRTTPIELGAMIETPAAALMADRIAAAADFLSIGTNDLTQYTLAMDRGHPELAARLDALHPAVLRLIARTVSAAQQCGRGIAVCGGLASDPAAVPILIGLGVHELSAVPTMIPQLKALIGRVSMDTCRELARQALEEESAAAVRALAVGLLSSSHETEPVTP